MSASYNKMSSIKVGGTSVNTIPSGVSVIGNVSLDITGQTYLRDKLFVGNDASFNTIYSSVVPTTANMLCNKTYVDSVGGTSILSSNNTFTGTNNFTSTLTSTGTTNINVTGTSATSIGNTSATLALKGSTNTITGATNINTTGTANTLIGNTTGTTTITGATNGINGDTTITGPCSINTSGLSDTNIGVSTATSGGVLIQGQNINFIAYDSIQLEATNAYWTNIGAGNFYYRAYNGLPQIIIGNQTTAVDYMAIQATSTGSSISVYSQPLAIYATAVNVNNLVAGNASLSTSTVKLSVPLQMESAYTTYPINTATAIGRYQSTTGTTKFTASATNILSLAIPTAGCYIVEAQWYFSGTTFTAETYTTISISTTSGAVDNTRQITAYQGGVSGNYAGHITSVVNFTSASTAYFVGLAGTALGSTSVQNNSMSITRIA